MRVVFFGSPEFAVASLEALLASKHQLLGVVTQPDRPKGRGLKMSPSDVKVVAQKADLPIFQPEKLNCQETYDWLTDLNPDILCVVAYGEFLGQRLLQFCKFNPVNVHPSLLPQLRGAAPMQWALLNGLTKSGVTTQYMVKEMDAGDILLQEESIIDPNENAQELQDRLKKVGGRLLVETLNGLEAGSLKPRPQDPSQVSLAPLLTKEQGQIEWQKYDAAPIHNQVRGLYPWPSAYTFFQTKRCKILRTKVPEARACPQRAATPGEFILFGDSLFVMARDSWLEILQIQPEANRAMLPAEFVGGIKEANSVLRFEFQGVL